MKLVLTLLLAVLACIYRLVLPGLAMRGNVLRNYCWKRFGGFKLLSKVQWGFAVMNGRIARFISTGWPSGADSVCHFFLIFKSVLHCKVPFKCRIYVMVMCRKRLGQQANDGSSLARLK